MSVSASAIQEFDAVRKEMHEFIQRFQAFSLQHRLNILTTKLQHVNKVKELEKRVKSLQVEITATNEKVEKTETLITQSIRGLQTKQEKVDALTNQLESRKAAKVQLQKDVDSMRKEVGELEEAFNNTHAALGKQALKDSEELTKFEQYLGLRIEAVDIDLLKFKFVNVDPVDVDREVWCELSVAEQDYKIGLTNPSLPKDVVLRIQKELNLHGELVAFLQAMRQALRVQLS
uniref:Kinetochore protein SPC25 n=1 Tax=Candidozyma auris TaxID=498019 RepID=A0A0L0NN08_CANAR